MWNISPDSRVRDSISPLCWKNVKDLSSSLICLLLTSFLGSDGKEWTCNAGDSCLAPGLGRSPGEGMATHSRVLAWRIPWTEEPGGLQSIGLANSRTQLVNNLNLSRSSFLFSYLFSSVYLFLDSVAWNLFILLIFALVRNLRKKSDKVFAGAVGNLYLISRNLFRQIQGFIIWQASMLPVHSYDILFFGIWFFLFWLSFKPSPADSSKSLQFLPATWPKAKTIYFRFLFCNPPLGTGLNSIYLLLCNRLPGNVIARNSFILLTILWIRNPGRSCLGRLSQIHRVSASTMTSSTCNLLLQLGFPSGWFCLLTRSSARAVDVDGCPYFHMACDSRHMDGW